VKKPSPRQINLYKLRVWADQVKARDGEACVVCGKTGKTVSHHIINARNLKTRFELDNGIQLCFYCHKGSLLRSAHTGSLLFFMWLQENRKEQLERLLKLL